MQRATLQPTVGSTPYLPSTSGESEPPETPALPTRGSTASTLSWGSAPTAALAPPSGRRCGLFHRETFRPSAESQRTLGRPLCDLIVASCRQQGLDAQSSKNRFDEVRQYFSHSRFPPASFRPLIRELGASFHPADLPTLRCLLDLQSSCSSWQDLDSSFQGRLDQSIKGLHRHHDLQQVVDEFIGHCRQALFGEPEPIAEEPRSVDQNRAILVALAALTDKGQALHLAAAIAAQPLVGWREAVLSSRCIPLGALQHLAENAPFAWQLVNLCLKRDLTFPSDRELEPVLVAKIVASCFHTTGNQPDTLQQLSAKISQLALAMNTRAGWPGLLALWVWQQQGQQLPKFPEQDVLRGKFHKELAMHRVLLQAIGLQVANYPGNILGAMWATVDQHSWQELNTVTMAWKALRKGAFASLRHAAFPSTAVDDGNMLFRSHILPLAKYLQDTARFHDPDFSRPPPRAISDITDRLAKALEATPLNTQAIQREMRALQIAWLCRSFLGLSLDTSLDVLEKKIKKQLAEEIATDSSALETFSLLAERVGEYFVDGASNFTCLEKPIKEALSVSTSWGPFKQVRNVTMRLSNLQRALDELPEVQEERRLLRQHGYQLDNPDATTATYSFAGTRQDIGARNRQLQNMLGEYQDALLAAGIRRLRLDNVDIDVVAWFARSPSLKVLQNAIPTFAAALRLNGATTEAARLEAAEHALRTEHARQGKRAPTHVEVRLVRGFFNSVRCCGAGIVGCYAPDGVSGQKPVQNGIAATSKFIGLFDPSGAEIENIEVRFMKEGMYVYATYSNGHSFDTSPMWLSYFKQLLTGGVVPRIILAPQAPTGPAFATISRVAGCKVTETLALTALDRIFPNAPYDHQPELNPRTLCIDHAALIPPQTVTPHPDTRPPAANEPRTPAVRAVLSALRSMPQFKRMGFLIPDVIAYTEQREKSQPIVDVRQRMLTRCYPAKLGGQTAEQYIQPLEQLIDQIVRDLPSIPAVRRPGLSIDGARIAQPIVYR